MVESDLRIKSIEVLEDFLEDRISANQASDWALQVIASSQWEDLEPDLQRAVHMIFDLHDVMLHEKWVPTKADLQELKRELKESRGA